MQFLVGWASALDLRSRFILIGLAASLPLALVMLQLAQGERENAIDAAAERAALVASLAAERQRHVVEQARVTLTFIADSIAQEAEPGPCGRHLSRYISPYPWFDVLRISAPDGTGLCADPPEAERPNLSDRTYFKRALAGEKFVVSDMVVSRASGRPRIVAAVPVLREGRVTGVLSAGIKLEALTEALTVGLNERKDVTAFLLDQNGTLIARRPENHSLIGKQLRHRAVVQSALRNPEGETIHRDLLGVPRLFAFRKLPQMNAVVAAGLPLHSITLPVDEALKQRLLLVLGIFAGWIIIGLIFAEFLVFKPLRSLGRTASALEAGDLTARTRLRGLGEVGALARALNRMADAVTDREEQLRAARKEAEDAVDRAEHANHAKTDFLASMSHEIRTPLNGILGYADLLLTTELTLDQRRYAERIDAAASALLTVVNDILNFSKVEAGAIEIERRPFSLPALVDNTASIMHSFAQKKGIDIEVDLDPHMPRCLLGDEARLRQILLNLLNNAVKFTPKGRVRLKVEKVGVSGDGGVFRFSVTDTGIGIPKDKHHRLFKRFSQVHASASEYGGTGLGLAISKRLIELMGGKIGFASQTGQGSTFWVELALPETDVSELHAAAQPTRPAVRPAYILVADDLDMNKEIASLMLQAAGHQVDVVSDGAEAVEAVRKRRYDLVLMDVQMPNMDGVTATRQIRQLMPPARDVPIIAMTGNVIPRHVRSFREVGMDDHLGKPFTREELITMVQEHLPNEERVPAVENASNAEETLFDENAFQELRRLLGEDRAKLWLANLREQMQSFLDRANEASVDREDIAHSAHALVSQAGSFGFSEVSRQCRQLEDVCIHGGEIREELNRVEAACRAALRRISELN